MEEPKLVRRRENRKSTIKSGLTIGEKRERLETRNERMAARKKDKQKKAARVVATIIGFMALVGVLIALYFVFFKAKPTQPVAEEPTTFAPTIEILDGDSSATGGKITARMNSYIGQAERDFRDLGYTPTRAVIPAGSIREVDFYLEGHPGFIKMIIDRDTAVSVEDADRMLRYLAEQGITDFTYIDVRIDGKAYWK